MSEACPSTSDRLIMIESVGKKNQGWSKNEDRHQLL